MTGPEAEGDRLSFLTMRLGASFDSLVVSIPPGRSRLYDAAEWRDALVVVERGEIHIECRAGRFRPFRQGDVLWLTGLPLRALHNRGPETAVLTAVSRRGPAVGGADPG
jgi:hypothetical protein